MANSMEIDEAFLNGKREAAKELAELVKAGRERSEINAFGAELLIRRYEQKLQ